MKVARTVHALRTACRPQTSHRYSRTFSPLFQAHRHFQTSAHAQKVQKHILSDIGEGVKEVQIIQWFVEEGAAVEEWAPLCEVQSDKASVEITSKYTGVVKKLHFDRDAIVQVGDSMLDIEVEAEDSTESHPEEDSTQAEDTSGHAIEDDTAAESRERSASEETPRALDRQADSVPTPPEDKQTRLATPAVRALLREHRLKISEIAGTGKDGRVLKEDVHNHLGSGQSRESHSTPTIQKPDLDAKQVETKKDLTPVQSAMFKAMTKSLSIPHFLFSDSINVTSLAAMRRNLNASRDLETVPKLSYLPFIIKAVSLALNQYPILNARLSTTDDSGRPTLALRSNHNIGIAMDTPAGLLVPVIRNVNARSIVSIAQDLGRLSHLGHANQLSSNDLTGGTITVSNVGNIGGEVVGPVIVEGQLAIMGIGKIKPTPIFAADGKTVERAEMMNASWSADHRVIDGATMARMARLVQGYLEQPETMMIHMS